MLCYATHFACPRPLGALDVPKVNKKKSERIKKDEGGEDEQKNLFENSVYCFLV